MRATWSAETFSGYRRAPPEGRGRGTEAGRGQKLHTSENAKVGLLAPGSGRFDRRPRTSSLEKLVAGHPPHPTPHRDRNAIT